MSDLRAYAESLTAFSHTEILKKFSRLSEGQKEAVLLGESGHRIVCYDIEATHLKPNVGRILCCSFKPLDGEVYTFSALERKFKQRDVYDDSKLAAAIRDELESYDLIVGHNGKLFDCMTPDTPVLTADLRWVPAGDIKAGDRLTAFEEAPSGPRRRMQFATVVQNVVESAPVCGVELETGEVFYATPEHPWLVATEAGPGRRHRWRQTRHLMGHGHPNQKPALLTRVAEPWESDDTFGAGWLSGFFDGEGCLIHEKGGSLRGLSGAQCPGAVLERARRYLLNRGFAVSIRAQKSPAGYGDTCTIVVRGGIPEVLRALGTLQPVRLVEEWQQMPLPALRKQQAVRVVRVWNAGEKDIARLGTTSGTYIAGGYAVHNTRFINSRCVRAGERTKRAQCQVDTMWVWRSKFNAWSGLDALQHFIDPEGESKTTIDWQQWMRALGWDKELREQAVAEIVAHCEADVRVLERVYVHMVKAGAVRSLRRDGGVL